MTQTEVHRSEKKLTTGSLSITHSKTLTSEIHHLHSLAHTYRLQSPLQGNVRKVQRKLLICDYVEAESMEQIQSKAKCAPTTLYKS